MIDPRLAQAEDLADLTSPQADRLENATSRQRSGTRRIISSASRSSSRSLVRSRGSALSRTTSPSDESTVSEVARPSPLWSRHASRSATVTIHAFQLRSRSGWRRMNCTKAKAQASSMSSGDVFTNRPTRRLSRS
jgi:hypothetical protein